MTQTGELNPAAQEHEPILVEIVDSLDDFYANIWGHLPYEYVLRDRPPLISSREVWESLDCGLIVHPYFRLLADVGEFVEVSSPTVVRNVVNNPLGGYPDVAEIRRAFDHGTTIGLFSAELWNLPIRELVTSLAQGFPGQARTQLCYAAPNSSGLLLGTDRSHSFVFQIEGEADWDLSERAGDAPTYSPGHYDFHLQPGKVLYVPPTYQKAQRNRATESLYLIVDLVEPSATDLAEVMLAQFLQSASAQEIAGSHHTMALDEKTDWLRQTLSGELAQQNLGEIVRQAVQIRKSQP